MVSRFQFPHNGSQRPRRFISSTVNLKSLISNSKDHVSTPNHPRIRRNDSSHDSRAIGFYLRNPLNVFEMRVGSLIRSKNDPPFHRLRNSDHFESPLNRLGLLSSNPEKDRIRTSRSNNDPLLLNIHVVEGARPSRFIHFKNRILIYSSFCAPVFELPISYCFIRVIRSKGFTDCCQSPYDSSPILESQSVSSMLFD